MCPHQIVYLDLDIVSVSGIVYIAEYPGIKGMGILASGIKRIAIRLHIAHNYNSYRFPVSEHCFSVAIIVIIKVNIDRQPGHTKDGQVDCRATFQH